MTRRTFARRTAALLAGATLASCRSPGASRSARDGPRRHTGSREALGTTFRVTLYAADPRTAAAAMSSALERLADVDSALNGERADSELASLNASPERRPVKVGDDLFAVLQQARRFAGATRGAFDITRGPYLDLWLRARAAGRTPSRAEIEDARLRVGWDKLWLDAIERTATLSVPGMRLDLDGIARGYATDQLMQQLRLHGCDQSKVEAAGVQFLGAPPPDGQWSVPLGATAPPNGPRAMPLDRAAAAFVGIGSLRGRDPVPTVDPRTGVAVGRVVPLLVVARSAAVAESVAAAAAVLGPAGAETLTRAEPTARVRFAPVTA